MLMKSNNKKGKEQYKMMIDWSNTFSMKKKEPRRCPYLNCPYNGGDKYRLVSHINSVHIQFLAFPCYICQKKFHATSKLNRHIQLCGIQSSSQPIDFI